MAASSTFDVTLMGVNISFKTNVARERVEAARALTEERFDRFAFHGRQMSREKALAYITLGLADDLLQAERQLAETRERLEALLTKIENAENSAKKP